MPASACICRLRRRGCYGHTRYNLRSRFIDELPAGLLKWLGVSAPKRGATHESAFDPALSGMNGHGHGSPAGLRTGARRPASAAAGGNGSGFRIGQNVAHARFGPGVVVALEGSGSDARAQIRFEQAGTKWLALSVARLQTL